MMLRRRRSGHKARCRCPPRLQLGLRVVFFFFFGPRRHPLALSGCPRRPAFLEWRRYAGPRSPLRSGPRVLPHRRRQSDVALMSDIKAQIGPHLCGWSGFVFFFNVCGLCNSRSGARGSPPRASQADGLLKKQLPPSSGVAGRSG